MQSAPILGYAAALIHGLGYVLYVRGVWRGDIHANVPSWLMFAYGTTLLLVLELAAGAGPSLLVLPAVCSAGSIVVGALGVRQVRAFEWPATDIVAFVADLLLTVVFLLAWLIQHRLGARWEAVTVVLLLGSLGTNLTSFAPIIVSTWRMPRIERPGPWVIWAMAYGLLLLASLAEQVASVLLLYPALNLVLHGLVAVLAVARGTGGEERIGEFVVRQTPRTGRGLFTTRPYAAGEVVLVIQGPERCESYDAGKSEGNPNWIGIDVGRWIDPEPPATFLNHSCNANLGFRSDRELVAVRAIPAGEELTIDYSFTEADPGWSMQCRCGMACCRKVLRAIQFQPRPNQTEPRLWAPPCLRRLASDLTPKQLQSSEQARSPGGRARKSSR
jgi:hypothetical protein